jgi:hypothetical protein
MRPWRLSDFKQITDLGEDEGGPNSEFLKPSLCSAQLTVNADHLSVGSRKREAQLLTVGKVQEKLSAD